MAELPETLPPERRHAGGLAATITSMRDVITDRVFLANALCFGLGVGAVFCYVSASSFVLENIYGLSPQRFSLVFASNAVGLVFASQVNAHLVGRLGSSRMLSAGIATLAGGALLLGLAVLFEPKDLLAILPPLFLAVTSVGLIIPNATALALNDFPDSAGSASAVLGVLQFGIGALVAPLVGLGGSHDARPMATLIALLALGSIGCRVWSVRQTEQPPAIAAATSAESFTRPRAFRRMVWCLRCSFIQRYSSAGPVPASSARKSTVGTSTAWPNSSGHSRAYREAIQSSNLDSGITQAPKEIVTAIRHSQMIPARGSIWVDERRGGASTTGQLAAARRCS